MGLLKPILGIGQIYGNAILRGVNSYVSDVDIQNGFDVDIRFYSFDENYIGHIGIGYDNAPHLLLDVTVNKLGGLISAKITTSRKIDIPFFNGMVTKIFVSGVLWFTAELVYLPEQDDRKTVFNYQLKGYWNYTSKIIINELYENKTISYILNDLIENYAVPNSPIQYSPDRISPPNVTLTKFEINDKSLKVAIDELLKISNYQYATNQYHAGVDENRIFYFEEVSDNIQYAFFEGYQYQNPEVEKNDDKLVNKIKIYRAIEDSDDVEYVSTIEDTESQGRYGIREDKITISAFFDTTTAEKFAMEKIERFKDPITSLKINDLNHADTPYPIGKYAVNNKIDTYNILFSEMDDLSLWTQSVVNTVLTQETGIVLTGRKSIKAVTTAGSQGEYMELELSDSIMYPLELIFYMRQNPKGEAINITVYDDDGNSLDWETGLMLTEDGDFILTEDGDFIQLETQGIGLDILLIETWQKRTFDISSLENVKKIRIWFNTNEDITMYYDRLEILMRGWKQNILIPDEIKYKLSKQSFLVDMELGEKFANAIDEIKDLKDKQNNLYNIFEKS